MSFIDFISTCKNGPSAFGTVKAFGKTLFKPTTTSSCDGVKNGQMCCFDAKEAKFENAPHCSSINKKSYGNPITNPPITNSPASASGFTSSQPTIGSSPLQISRPYFVGDTDHSVVQ